MISALQEREERWGLRLERRCGVAFLFKKSKRWLKHLLDLRGGVSLAPVRRRIGRCKFSLIMERETRRVLCSHQMLEGRSAITPLHKLEGRRGLGSLGAKAGEEAWS